jgi:hypothetical protein
MRNVLYSPFSRWTQKTLISVGHHIDLVRWAESGGRHDASWNDLPLDVWSCRCGVVGHFTSFNIADYFFVEWMAFFKSNDLSLQTQCPQFNPIEAP